QKVEMVVPSPSLIPGSRVDQSWSVNPTPLGYSSEENQKPNEGSRKPADELILPPSCKNLTVGRVRPEARLCGASGVLQGAVCGDTQTR
ncbi:hypothetical protein M9458_053832, partial [Cirrhinus mrigala]